MADVNRKTVDKLVLHHAVTPLWEDKSKAWIAQWFSDNGFARAYGSNPNNWSGLYNPFTGARSYAQAQLVGQRVTAATPDATDAERALGYRVFEIVKDVWGQIAWHAGNWSVNQSSLGIENLGDYRNYALRDGDMRAIAAYWRPQDVKLGGATAIYLHGEVTDTGTACPARIAEGRNTIVNYVNNPPQPPQPPKPTKPTWVGMDNPRAMRTKVATSLVNVVTGAVVKSYAAGEKIENLAQKTDWNGKQYLRTAYSATTNVDNGFDVNTLEELPTVVIKEESKTEEVAFQIVKSTDATLPVGQEKVTRPGVKGVRTIVYSVTYTNNVETARTVKSDSVTKAAVDELVAVGSYVAPPTTPPVVPVPEEGQTAVSWLQAVFNWVKEVLAKFTYKK